MWYIVKGVSDIYMNNIDCVSQGLADGASSGESESSGVFVVDNIGGWLLSCNMD